MKRIETLPLSEAREIALDLTTKRGVDLLLPYGADGLRREVVLRGIALVHSLHLGGWDLETARQRVSVTVPGIGLGTTDVLRAIPPVQGVDIGSVLAGVFKPLERTGIIVAPVLWGPVDDASHGGDPHRLLGTIAHEHEHDSQLHVHGTAVWALCYGGVPGLRGWGEAQGYAQSLAGEVLLCGTPIDVALAMVHESLAGYGLPAEALRVADDVLEPAVLALRDGAVPSGPICDVLLALRALDYDVRVP